MSSAPIPPPPSAPAGTAHALAPAAPPPEKREITLISHSMLFYWWPIWLLGYIFALVTYFEDHRLVIVPAGSKVTVDKSQSEPSVTTYQVKVKEDEKQAGSRLAAASLQSAAEATMAPGDQPVFPTRISRKTWMGPVFCTILLLTVIITNVPLRGLWSFLVLLLILIVVLGISMLPGGWDHLLGAIGNLHIYINMAGYLFIASTVLLLWAVSVFIFDRRTYMVVTPGSIRVCEHIGASIRNYDTTGMAFEKQRDDIFRHWLLGFFSGDLIVRTSGAEHETIRLPNVLWISWRLEEVQHLLREKMMVGSKP